MARSAGKSGLCEKSAGFWGNDMNKTKLEILRTLNRPDAVLSIVDQKAQIQISQPHDEYLFLPLQSPEGGPFFPKDYVPLIAAGCLIPALSLGFGLDDKVYRIWDMEVSARTQGTQHVSRPARGGLAA